MPAIDSNYYDSSFGIRLYVLPNDQPPASYDLTVYQPEDVVEQIADQIDEAEEDITLDNALQPLNLGYPTADGHEVIIHTRTYSVRGEVRGHWLLSLLELED